MCVNIDNIFYLISLDFFSFSNCNPVVIDGMTHPSLQIFIFTYTTNLSILRAGAGKLNWKSVRLRTQQSGFDYRWGLFCAVALIAQP